ncbi:MAG TPA: cytochrome b/b6 domain-containing protein [Cyclobacteriaceae bacterium]|nr:cytochrome b/b6 domain-containing protein [Cyclobacteriaceae bacterium]
MPESQSETPSVGHRLWVRLSHWLITLTFFGLAFTGIEILMVHPRLYWGEVGNDLTPALIELPISRNYKHGGWENKVAFFDGKSSPISASRTYDIFNYNGWGRSLHFLLAWLLVITGSLYLVMGLFTGHFYKHIWPRLRELTPRAIYKDIVAHLRLKNIESTPGNYNLSQRITYALVIFWLFPVMLITGLTMSPAVTAALPFLLDWSGGLQSARTMHFLVSVALELFLILHFVMVIVTGFKKHIVAMTVAK